VTVLLAGALLADGSLSDVLIDKGRIAAIGTVAAMPPDAMRIELAGRLLMPAFVDGHIHLDKTFLGMKFQSHRPAATLMGRIESERTQRREADLGIEERGAALVRQASTFGTTAMRSHVDIDPDSKLDGLHALLRLREAVRDIMDIQIVAFPQSGLVIAPGIADLLDQAVGEGADLVGGLDPAGIDGDVAASLDIIFGIAERRGVGVDIHLHDAGPLGCFELRQIAARTKACGLNGRVAVSHAYALGDVDASELGRTASALAEAGVAIMTNGPGSGAMPPLRAMAEAGVVVFAGSDNIRDAWWPYGNGDMLERAMIIGYRQNIRTDEGLTALYGMASVVPAQVLGLGCTGLAVGAVADLVALDAQCVAEAVVSRPMPRWVMKAGQVVSQP
jgi:cytosine deaminase